MGAWIYRVEPFAGRFGMAMETSRFHFTGWVCARIRHCAEHNPTLRASRPNTLTSGTKTTMLQSPKEIIEQQLDPGERLLWAGQPRSGIRFRPQDVFLIPFSILWCGFVIFWEVSVIRSNAPFFFMLWGIPFVCAGLFIVFGRFFFDSYNREHTAYGVTSERILIVSGIFTQQIKSLQIRTLADMSLTQRSDGSGTIAFGPTHYMSSLFPAGAWPGTGRYAPPSFDLLDNVKEVYDIIRNAQRATLTKG